MCARGSGWPPPRRGLAFLAGSAPTSTAWPPSAGVGPGATVPWPPPKEPVVRVGGGHRGVSGLPRRSVPLRHQAGSRVLWGLARAGFPRPGLPGGAQPSAAWLPAPALSSLPGGSAHRYLGSRAWGVSPAPTQRGAGRAHSLSRGWSRLGRGRGGKACLLLGTENASGEPSRSPSPGVDLRARPAVSPSQPGCDASPRWAVSLPECCDRSPPGPSPSLRCAAAFSSDLRSPGRGLLALLPVRQFPGSEVPALRFVTAAASWTQDPAC